MSRLLTSSPLARLGLIFGHGALKIYPSSGSFTVPENVFKIRVVLLGPGGSGAAAATGSNDLLSAGGGGGWAIKEIDVVPGQVIPFIVGAGGIAAGTTLGRVDGHDGGTTSFGTYFEATGGMKGLAVVSNPILLSGGLGGLGSGGDMNFRGGDGGDHQGGINSDRCAPGGGSAASVYGNGYKGGSITAANNALSAAGGAGIGGVGANVATTGVLWTAGGGSGTPAVGQVRGKGLLLGLHDAHTSAVDYPIVAPMALHPLFPLLGPGGDNTNAPGPGGGSAGKVSASTSVASAAAGVCAGSGGAVGSAGDGFSVNSGAPGLGAGSGAAFNTASGGGSLGASAAAGGNGLVIVEY